MQLVMLTFTDPDGHKYICAARMGAAIAERDQEVRVEPTELPDDWALTDFMIVED